MTDAHTPEDILASQLEPLALERQAAEPAAEPAAEFAPAYKDRLAALPASFQKKVHARVVKAGINPAEESAALDTVFAEYTGQYLRKRESSRLGAARRRDAKKAAAQAAKKAAEPAEPAESE